MNCTEFEILLADYVDGALGENECATLDAHAAACASCRELMQDVADARAFLKRAPELETPPELITRIAYQAPIGRTRRPFERQGLFSRFAARWLQPMLQPRLAMGMAMTILSFAMLERCTGVKVQRIPAADLNPVRIWGGLEDKTIRLKDRAVKYYENLRLVYDIETRLKTIEDQQEAAAENRPSESSRTVAGKEDRNSKKDNTGARAPDQGLKKK